MSSRAVALGASCGCLALVLAQDVFPAWNGFHTWQYAGLLLLCGFVVTAYALAARKGDDGDVGARLVVAMIGVLVVAAAGLASGLLGPDTETVARAPGTVVPLPDIGAAAFFDDAGAGSIERGDAHVQLRRRDGGSFDLGPAQRRFIGATEVELRSQVAAYVEARDPRGERLTVTQPTNPTFLSPVLLFPQSVPIAGQMLPADSFATPALHRQIKAFYFSESATTAAKARGLAGKAAVLFAVDDDREHLLPNGIGFAESRGDVTLGGVRLLTTLGTYPALIVSAVPYPPALLLGLATFVAGLGFAFVRPRTVDPALRASKA